MPSAKIINRITLSIATVLSLDLTPLAAQDLRGWCFPADACMGRQIPIGSGTYEGAELPCGMQVMGPWMRDLDCIHAADQIAKILHG